MSITDTQPILNELSLDPITTVYKPNYSNFKSHTFQNCFPWFSSANWDQICEALKNLYKSDRFERSLLQQTVLQERGKQVVTLFTLFTTISY